MLIMRSNKLVGCLLLAFISISALQSLQVLGGRYLHENYQKNQDQPPHHSSWTSNNSNSNSEEDVEDFFATSNRVVPSSPDPLHNR
ncbi:hypothetical protein LguiA_026236 [Lonicera macranthoides]